MCCLGDSARTRRGVAQHGTADTGRRLHPLLVAKLLGRCGDQVLQRSGKLWDLYLCVRQEEYWKHYPVAPMIDESCGSPRTKKFINHRIGFLHGTRTSGQHYKTMSCLLDSMNCQRIVCIGQGFAEGLCLVS